MLCFVDQITIFWSSNSKSVLTDEWNFADVFGKGSSAISRVMLQVKEVGGNRKPA